MTTPQRAALALDLLPRPGSGLDLCDAVERAEGVADVTLVPREKSSL
ncbi:MAG: hypothetical protein WD015_07525 [Gaiellaceae bacterium]